MTTRTDFPVFPAGVTRAMGTGDAPIMLDGMEVLFDRLVGLAPVTLVAKPTAATPTTARPGSRHG